MEEFFLPFEEYCKLEADIEDENYRSWVEKYPEHIYKIFDMILLATNPNIQDIQFFVDHGLDLNHIFHYYGEFGGGLSTPLFWAAEFMKLDLFENLLKCGCDPHIETGDGFNILEAILIGHNPDRASDCEGVEKCLHILEKYVHLEDFKIKNDWVVPELCQNFISQSEYLSKIIREAS